MRTTKTRRLFAASVTFCKYLLTSAGVPFFSPCSIAVMNAIAFLTVLVRDDPRFPLFELKPARADCFSFSSSQAFEISQGIFPGAKGTALKCCCSPSMGSCESTDIRGRETDSALGWSSSSSGGSCSGPPRPTAAATCLAASNISAETFVKCESHRGYFLRIQRGKILVEFDSDHRGSVTGPSSWESKRAPPSRTQRHRGSAAQPSVELLLEGGES